jgi:hypothetical protein
LSRVSNIFSNSFVVYMDCVIELLVYFITKKK